MSFRKNGKKIKFDIDRKTRVRRSISRTKRSTGSKLSVHFAKDRGRTIVKGPLTLLNIFKTAKKGLVRVVGTAIAAVLIFGTISAIDIHLGSEVIVNGQTIGYITNKKEFSAILDEARELAKAANDGQNSDDIKPTYIPRLVSDKEVTPAFNLKQNLLANYDQLIEAYAVYCESELICAALDEEEAFEALNSIKEKYADSEKDVVVEFEEEIVVRKEFVPIAQIVSGEGIETALSGNSRNREIYTVGPGETLEDIAQKFGMETSEILALNKDAAQGIFEGQKINVMRLLPTVAVRTETVEHYSEILRYETKTEQTDALTIGRSKVVAKGSNGQKDVVAKVVRVNGQEVERIIQSETVIKEASAETVQVGTKASTPAQQNITVAVGLGSGQLMRPVYGSISSRFGSRWGSKHEGIDISVPVGTDVKAADNGTVICAAYEGAYGYLVQIDHGNGIVTYYAHNSKLLCSPGQRVSKGDIIAKSGNTGRSTGPHVHFEVRKNGVPVNPEPYL